MQSWTIGIICFNEKSTIRSVFLDARAVLEEITNDYEIILVDDASEDGSTKIIESIGREEPHTKVVLHNKNQGIGASIRDVYFNASKENLVFIPGDGQFDVKELLDFASFSPANYICFFRKENETYSLQRNFISYLNKLFNSKMLGLELKDVNWVKVYKTAIVQQLNLKTNSSIIESEICAKLNKLGLKPIEKASKYLPRNYGSSKGASWLNLFRVSKELLKLCFVVFVFKDTKFTSVQH